MQAKQFCRGVPVSLFLCVLLLSVQAQNLVQNPSFEYVREMPCGIVTSDSMFNALFAHYSTPSHATPDVWTIDTDPLCENFALGTNSYVDFKTKKALFGIQVPYDGNTMVGLATYLPDKPYREYLQVHLSEPLRVGKKYRVRFWVAVANQVRYTTNGLGIALCEERVAERHTNVLESYAGDDYVGQILTNRGKWLPVEFTVKVNKPAAYLLIGNFLAQKAVRTLRYDDIDDSDGYTKNCAYCFIDALSVELAEDDFTYPGK